MDNNSTTEHFVVDGDTGLYKGEETRIIELPLDVLLGMVCALVMCFLRQATYYKAVLYLVCAGAVLPVAASTAWHQGKSKCIVKHLLCYRIINTVRKPAAKLLCKIYRFIREVLWANVSSYAKYFGLYMLISFAELGVLLGVFDDARPNTWLMVMLLWLIEIGLPQSHWL